MFAGASLANSDGSRLLPPGSEFHEGNASTNRERNDVTCGTRNISVLTLPRLIAPVPSTKVMCISVIPRLSKKGKNLLLKSRVLQLVLKLNLVQTGYDLV